MRAKPSPKLLVCRATASVSVGPNCDRAMTDRDADASTLKCQGLYPCEAEIARRLSQSQKRWRQIAPEFERQGLPKIDPVMKGRFWPAVEHSSSTAMDWAILPPHNLTGRNGGMSREPGEAPGLE
jgi:hypothetical protein